MLLASSLAVGLAALVLGQAVVPGTATPPLPRKGEALIENTGSTNTTGYRVFVQPSGRVSYVVTRRRDASGTDEMQSGRVPKEMARKLFDDIAAAGPLSSVPAGHGFKSVSFGTSTYITVGSERTPDLSFPAGPKARALAGDATAIAAALHLKNGPRRPAQPMQPSLPGH